MNRITSILLGLSLLLCTLGATAQEPGDTLPKFSVKNIGSNRIVIGWVNNYPVVKQISIQSSHDSLVNYKTILSVADPNAKENGFADTKAPTDHMYYRLLVVLDGGQFFFTTPKRPAMDTARLSRVTAIDNNPREPVTIGVKPTVGKKPDFIPSFYVYTNPEGYVYINLPDASEKKYHIKFYEDDNSFLFEIKNIKESGLTLDKTNFMHAGWFKFELYNDDKLVEKNKLYLAKDF